MDYNDTIMGLLTPQTNSGVTIIRISGENAFEIVSKIFTGKLIDHQINYGKIIYKETLIDECLISFFKGPKSYTKEDVIEINCHGGIVTSKKIMNILSKEGVSLARNGEFTRRAFLNGRIDLTKAEATMNIINSRSDREQEISVNQLSGKLSEDINYFRNEILELIAYVESSLDYPEHDLEHDNITLIDDKIHFIKDEIDNLLKSYDKGKLIKDGIDTGIIGVPNVGKSSLLNKLVGEDVAIVTEMAGTTRDTVKEFITFNGIVLNLIDTAGIRKTDNIVEKIGVEKAKEIGEKSQLVLFLLDGSREITEEEIKLINIYNNKKTIYLVNKIDINPKININNLYKYVDKEKTIFISIKENIGIDKIYNKIEEIFLEGALDNSSSNFIVNERHNSLLIKVSSSLEKVIDGINLGMSEDLISIDLKDAYEYLGEILGLSIDDDIIDKIFSKFCLGK